jgi:superfamily I DNA/RNA helicase
MARLAMAKSAMQDYARLDRPIRAKVDALWDKFAEHTHAGLHLEKLTNARDPRLRTVRVDQFYRGIVLASDSGDLLVLVRIVTHDEADRWAPRHVFKINPASGAAEVVDVGAEEAPPPPAGADLLAHRADSDLLAVGIDPIYLPLLRAATDHVQLAAYTAAMPELQRQAAYLLAADHSTDDILDIITGGEVPEAVDTEDIGAALARPASAASFLVAVDGQELREALARPFDLWRVFLHPQQRAVAYRDGYQGPVRITGGPGTGKTVVAVHRARHLAQRPRAGTHRILLTSFSRTLADALRHLVDVLGDVPPDLVDVATVDAVAHRVITEATGTAPEVVDAKEEDRLWARVARRARQPRFSAHFLQQEWRQVVLAQQIHTLDGYRSAVRTGRGIRLAGADRERVWQAFDDFRGLLAGRLTLVQLADVAADVAHEQGRTWFDHAVVDEAQDLHPAQWRLLRAVTGTGFDDMFIVGDAHQRIYGNRTVLSRHGIDVRGRSRRLTVNYRTTEEILRWSAAHLDGTGFDDLDGGGEDLAGYHSSLHGYAPEVDGFADRPAELDNLTAAVLLWTGEGVEPGAIGVLARTNALADEAYQALRYAGVAAVRLSERVDDRDDSTVKVATMHRAKGLEFRCVAIQGVDADVVPMPRAVTPAKVDAAQHARDIQQERNLLFVACTRARDALRISYSGEPSPFLR